MRAANFHTVVVALALTLALGVAERPANAEPGLPCARDYRLYKAWESGRADPQLDGVSESAKVARIAHSLGISVEALQHVIADVGAQAATVAPRAERSITEELGTTPIGGRVREIHVDADQGHVVAGVKWQCGDARDVDVEASYAAWAVAHSASIVETLLVWCVDGSDTKLFSATIGRTAFERIAKSSIERFARSRYIRLFEDIKRGPHT